MQPREGVREASVAGSFYPADAAALRREVGGYLEAVEAEAEAGAPKALIVPHAGYVYSGAVAASAYARLRRHASSIERVVLVGPAHFVPVRGLAASSADVFLTPLGPVPIDRSALARALDLPQVRLLDAAHEEEHSLEVHLPFLQTVLGEFRLVPLLAGDATPREVAEVLELLWGGPETLIMVSSDLSHYHDYQTARRLDSETARAVERLEWERLGSESACGVVPVRGLLEVARRRGLRARTLDLRNSGDTAGSRREVVGYGAFAFAGAA